MPEKNTSHGNNVATSSWISQKRQSHAKRPRLSIEIISDHMYREAWEFEGTWMCCCLKKFKVSGDDILYWCVYRLLQTHRWTQCSRSHCRVFLVSRTRSNNTLVASSKNHSKNRGSIWLDLSPRLLIWFSNVISISRRRNPYSAFTCTNCPRTFKLSSHVAIHWLSLPDR